VPPDCHDGDPCTDDSCIGASCIHTPLTGYASVNCALDAGLVAPGCEGDVLRIGIPRRFERSRELTAKAEHDATVRNANKRLRHVVKLMRQVQKVIARDLREQKISPECAAALTGYAAEAQANATILLGG
jgi:hypothetical protein